MEYLKIEFDEKDSCLKAVQGTPRQGHYTDSAANNFDPYSVYCLTNEDENDLNFEDLQENWLDDLDSFHGMTLRPVSIVLADR